MVRRVIFPALPLLLGLAGIGGYLLATHSLAPLNWMAKQAREITGSNLNTCPATDNAIRYTPPGGKVSAVLEADAACACIHISDTGVGIPPEAAPHVFDRFYRADKARSRQDGGFGLGLSIVKWIAEAHNGTVELTRTSGPGTTFTVTLPR